jgi:hypothetical protein
VNVTATLKIVTADGGDTLNAEITLTGQPGPVLDAISHVAHGARDQLTDGAGEAQERPQ